MNDNPLEPNGFRKEEQEKYDANGKLVVMDYLNSLKCISDIVINADEEFNKGVQDHYYDMTFMHEVDGQKNIIYADAEMRSKDHWPNGTREIGYETINIVGRKFRDAYDKVSILFSVSSDKRGIYIFHKKNIQEAIDKGELQFEKRFARGEWGYFLGVPKSRKSTKDKKDLYDYFHKNDKGQWIRG